MATWIVYLIVGSLLLIQLFRGMRRGFSATLVGLVGLVVALVVSHLAAIPVGALVAKIFGWSQLTAMLVSGLVIFGVLSLIFEFLVALLRRRARRKGLCPASVELGNAAVL